MSQEQDKNTEQAKKKLYKASLNLPKTDFDMRAGLLKKEPAIQAEWQEGDLYGAIRQANEDGESFLLHDPKDLETDSGRL